jgi:1-aminocyclopropane-1-carboxylate synthase
MMEAIGRAFGNPYDPKTNEKGIISLGIAENTPMYPELAEFLEENMHITPNLLGYGGVIPGPPGLMNGLLGFINAPPFNPVIPVVDKHLYFTAGCTALLDQVFWTLCDEGEGILISMPMYGGFANDMQVRGKCNLLQVNLKGYDVFSNEAIVRYEEELLAAEKKGIKTRVLVLCTPHNPLGQYAPFSWN